VRTDRPPSSPSSSHNPAMLSLIPSTCHVSHRDRSRVGAGPSRTCAVVCRISAAAPSAAYASLPARRLHAREVIAAASTPDARPPAERNAEQLNEVLMELAALRQRGEEDMEEEEFEDGEWVWWRADDKDEQERPSSSPSMAAGLAVQESSPAAASPVPDVPPEAAASASPPPPPRPPPAARKRKQAP
jgi:hypothetical protein